MPEQERRLYPHCRNFNFAREETPRSGLRRQRQRDESANITTCKSYKKARNKGYTRIKLGRGRLLRERQMRRKLRNAVVLSRNVSLSFSSLSKSYSLTLSCRSQSRQTSTKVMFFKFRQLRCLVIFVNFTCDIGSSKIWVIAHCRN